LRAHGPDLGLGRRRPAKDDLGIVRTSVSIVRTCIRYGSKRLKNSGVPNRSEKLLDVATEIAQTVRMIGLIASSSSGNELCRRMATDELFGIGTLGVQVYALTNTGRWQPLGSYGKNSFESQTLSQLDDNLLTEAARTRALSFGTAMLDDQEVDVIGCVYLRNDLPVGGIIRFSLKDSYIFTPDNGTLTAIQAAGGLFLDSIGYKTVANSQDSKKASPEDMTQRQMLILTEMALGKTNLVIANKMILSESTIKQESVKIFRALGVSTRQQAVLKAVTLGLLPEGVEIYF
jgi:DNA-binding CsgD family transcriptional regulator